MMCESEGQDLATYDALGEETPMERVRNGETTMERDGTESFDLYQWAMEFSQAAGFECDPLEPETAC